MRSSLEADRIRVVSGADLMLPRRRLDRPLRVAVVPGDGIGPEVVAATLPLVRLACRVEGVEVVFTQLEWGSSHYRSHGAFMPDDATDQIKQHDAVLFGAVGSPDIPDHLPVWGLILELRQKLDLYVNLRPVHHWAGVRSPIADSEGVDFVIIRENTEGEYSGLGWRQRIGGLQEVAYEVAVHSHSSIDRIARYAFEVARARKGRLGVATKSNALRYGYVLWDETVRSVANEYQDVSCEFVLVDALAARIIQRPGSLDVMLCSNLFGDILSDLAAPIQGGLGMAPSANFNPQTQVPGVYEPVHGSAPDICGKGVANPVGCILSAAMLLEHCGCKRASDSLVQAVADTVSDPSAHTPDLGGKATTVEVADRIGEALMAGTQRTPTELEDDGVTEATGMAGELR